MLAFGCIMTSVLPDVFYNEERFRNDQQIRRLQSDAANSIRNLADQFDLLFNNITTEKQ